eukprot:TRINITY_DN3742_c0_g2_i1.p1 TRINITY_DN3742_c0_g2~~TRINITY_DN3742_c0_g2_i1.p1  ORF type:complete len:685 (-),score=261.88 TRINITY_DN3742_c0_g2_i1:103-1932(-)
MPYNYYFLPLCPPDVLKAEPENLGEILRGDRIENSPYEIKALQDISCKVLCQNSYPVEDLKLFHEKIQQKYHAHWIIDNLPAMISDQQPAEPLAPPKYREEGFPLGVRGVDIPTMADKPESKHNFLNNHVDITLYYNEQAEGGARIVGFVVDPDSVKHSASKPGEAPASCQKREDYERQSVTHEQPTSITFTYSVKWVPTTLRWHNRWEPIFAVQSGKVHWFSILNSIVIVLFLTSMVAVIMTNILKSDFKRYSEMSSLAATTASLLTDDVEAAEDGKGKGKGAVKEDKEETGWKLVYADVFRPPPLPMLLSLLVGIGAQVTTCAVITMVFSVLGFLSPASRGSLLTAMIISFALTGIISGYFSGRLYKLFGGQSWKNNAWMTALLVQGIVFLIFFILDSIMAAHKSSGHIPAKVLMLLLAIWICVATPLVFFGSFLAFRAPTIDIPTKTNLIPRDIPPQPWYNNALVCVFLGGVLPFSAIFIELYFIMSSIWLDQIYYLFGFLTLVFLVLVIACSEVSIVLTYIQLCGEDWRWWWRSFLSVGASALYLFFYGVFYFFTKLQITESISIALYFGYTLIITIIFFTFTGSMGFFASFWFARKIYGSIKVD